MSYREFMALGVLALAVLAAGCRRVYTFIPVEGTITKDGRPLSGVQVIFFADSDAGTEGPRSAGTTDDAGHYRLLADSGELGVVMGKHRVCIFDTSSRESLMASSPKGGPASSKPRGRLRERPKSRVPAIYGQVTKTPLQAEVRPGGVQTFDFNIP